MKLSYIIDNILEAKTNLLRNVPRTILTSLGIVIGITSVIILVAITDGAKNIIEQQDRQRKVYMYTIFQFIPIEMIINHLVRKI